ncbi:hypothetical protein ACM25N_12530 [Roseovarius sp. C7]|uniref:hypothetical protein n=1 Tax=Roseovarius sp. C7 TaxID=3398643 RepID=UPI0039F6CCBF
MQIEKIEFDQVRYNPENGAFEALVKIHEDGISYSYPTQATAPLTAEFDVVTRRLHEAAARAHRDNLPALRSRHATTSAEYQARVAEILANGTLWPPTNGSRIAA